jgi:hypothetical protein
MRSIFPSGRVRLVPVLVVSAWLTLGLAPSTS